jgi:hypothetical protein
MQLDDNVKYVTTALNNPELRSQKLLTRTVETKTQLSNRKYLSVDHQVTTVINTKAQLGTIKKQNITS